MGQPSFAGPSEPYYAPGWQPARPAREPLAVAAFVTGVVGLGLVGIGLGVAALVRIGRRRTRGRGLAIAAIAVGAAWTLVEAAVVVVLVATSMATRPLPADVPAPRDAHAVALVTGNCLETLPPDGPIDVVRVVPCADPHEAQVSSQFAFAPDALWPGQAAADRRVALACQLSEADVAAGLAASVWAPTSRSWDDGDRTGLCLLHRADGARLTDPLPTPPTPAE
ncbi:DUF4190 domain-containing protein [Pengzhenrongella sicca]|uniref:DUF4190 domain-containing protein n=1 Tax=Pengzhenrongella sicca TaxID=2819238 RepID=A0A8A4ZGK6_9MICO|nr:DUF4190 domain-containing protein [Pengzhenrongella sicca]QTE29617.1 DUF4190 domain-containing protein [Pengzhenrongella sicca]